MSDTTTQKYSADAHTAEIYEQIEAHTEDVALLRQLIGDRRGLMIFEPCCGTGRVLIPLAEDGHQLVGLDESPTMLARLSEKLRPLPADVRHRVHLIQATVFAAEWPAGVDVVLLGGNCFYEMSSSDEQRALIHRAAAALRPSGYVYLDNDDHQSVTLQPRWQKPPGQPGRAFPSGACADGTVLEGSTETAWFDVQARLVHYIRRLRVTHPDGAVSMHEWRETCHPTIMADCLQWLEEAGFTVERTFGNRQGDAFGPDSPRCLVWARKT
jgi:SAM-dependent methyltransferase